MVRVVTVKPDIPTNLDEIKTSSEKANSDFRVYTQETSESRVINHYREMRMGQTVAFYRRMEQKYSFENGNYRSLMTMEEAFEELEHYVDASDPDLDLPNKLHLLQTAEAIRKAGHPDWFVLVGLLHDMGKIMFLWGGGDIGQDGYSPKGQQWALGGDTFVVGCEIPDVVVFPEFNLLNADMKDERYNTKYGMYTPHCGLDDLCLAWGHDEYMYRMLVANAIPLPPEAMDMIRYHSAYPMHDKGAYKHLLLPEDEKRLEWIQLFNRYDLYTKDETNDLRTRLDEIWPFYKELLDKYGMGGKLKW